MCHRIFLFSTLFCVLFGAVPNFAFWDQASRESNRETKLPPIFAASDPVRMKRIDYQVLSGTTETAGIEVEIR
jgi:hypothetical protein